MAHPECKYCDGGFHPRKVEDDLVCTNCGAPWEPVMVEDDDAEEVVLLNEDLDEDDLVDEVDEFADEDEVPEDWELEEPFIEDEEDEEEPDEFKNESDIPEIDRDPHENESEVPHPFVPEEHPNPDR